MDPNATLLEIVLAILEDDRALLHEKIVTMREWLAKDGFQPALEITADREGLVLRVDRSGRTLKWDELDAAYKIAATPARSSEADDW